MSFSGTKGYITKPKPGVMLNSLHPLSRGLVGCWLFNEGSGSLTNDISRKGNKGIISGATWTSKGILFDADNEKINLSSTINTGTTFSIIASIVNYKSVREWQVIIDNWDSGSAFNIHNDYIAMHYSGNDHDGTETLIAGNSYVCAIVVDGGSGKFYMDGQPDGTCSNVPSLPLNTIGDNQWNVNLESVLGYLYIFDRALSATEVQQLYHDPFCNLLQVPIRRYFVAVPPVGAIMNQIQKANIGADLYNGVFA